MAIYSVIENGIVKNRIIADDAQVIGLLIPDAELVVEETEATGVAFIGGEYRKTKNKFVPFQVYPSWIWNEKKFAWVAPTAEPIEGGPFYWDEETLSWIAVSTVIPIEPDGIA